VIEHGGHDVKWSMNGSVFEHNILNPTDLVSIKVIDHKGL